MFQEEKVLLLGLGMQGKAVSRNLTTRFIAMQRTIGYTMCIGAQLLMLGKFSQPGICSAIDAPFSLMRPQLATSNVLVTREEFLC